MRPKVARLRSLLTLVSNMNQTRVILVVSLLLLLERPQQIVEVHGGVGSSNAHDTIEHAQVLVDLGQILCDFKLHQKACKAWHISLGKRESLSLTFGLVGAHKLGDGQYSHQNEYLSPRRNKEPMSTLAAK